MGIKGLAESNGFERRVRINDLGESSADGDVHFRDSPAPMLKDENRRPPTQDCGAQTETRGCLLRTGLLLMMSKGCQNVKPVPWLPGICGAC